MIDSDDKDMFPLFVSDDGEVLPGPVLAPAMNLWAGRNTSCFAMTEFEPSRTEQEHAADSDINNIMAKYVKSGTVPQYLDRGMLDGDMHELSFHEMHNLIAEGNSAFYGLPASVRAEFGNDPLAFMDFALDDANRDKLREWGMLSPEAIERLDAAEAAKVAAAAEKPPSEPPAPSAPPAK